MKYWLWFQNWRKYNSELYIFTCIYIYSTFVLLNMLKYLNFPYKLYYILNLLHIYYTILYYKYYNKYYIEHKYILIQYISIQIYKGYNIIPVQVLEYCVKYYYIRKQAHNKYIFVLYCSKNKLWLYHQCDGNKE